MVGTIFGRYKNVESSRKLRPFEGELIIVNEVCWFKNWGAFKVNACDLKRFVESHRDIFEFYFLMEIPS